jgi:hypothetical protein
VVHIAQTRRDDRKPPILRTKNKTIVGTGCLIHQAEILKDIIGNGELAIAYLRSSAFICLHLRLKKDNNLKITHNQ